MNLTPAPPIVFSAKSHEELIFVRRNGRYDVVYSPDGAAFYEAAVYFAEHAAPGRFLRIGVPGVEFRDRAYHWNNGIAYDDDDNEFRRAFRTNYDGTVIELPVVVPGYIFFAKDGFNWHYLAFRDMRSGRLVAFTMLPDPMRPGEFMADEQQYSEPRFVSDREVHFCVGNTPFRLGGEDLMGVQQPSCRGNEPLTNLPISRYDLGITVGANSRISIRLKPKQATVAQ